MNDPERGIAVMGVSGSGKIPHIAVPLESPLTAPVESVLGALAALARPLPAPNARAFSGPRA
ncbi:hypothetical protein [Paenarthrobacter sp. 2TAF44]|uniref:hypothetical protein n=1 Tax=Paenarthrobacter sp. 2TAF44 TaxID=3233018 RepID=UPI003F96C9B3